jgi:IclR family transcriptional regulator, acetate operon repressor
MADRYEADASEEEAAHGGAPAVSATYRVTAVLYALTKPGPGLSVRAVAEQTGTSRSATHRILQSLVDEGYAVQGTGGRYLAGPRILQLAARAVASSSALRMADTIMASLVAEVNETSYLAALLPGEDTLTFIHRVECDQPLRYFQRLGVPLPFHRGAIGKAVLAARPELLEKLRDTDAAADPSFLRQLDEIRKRGYAVSYGERVEGVAAVASAVRIRDTVAGGLTVAVPIVRLPKERVGRLGQTVKDFAEQIGGALVAVGSQSF